MRTSVLLKLELADGGVRRSLLSVLAPDNRDLPSGLELSVKRRGPAGAEIMVRSSSPSASLSTVLSLLRDVTLFQEVWLLSTGKGGPVHRGETN